MRALGWLLAACMLTSAGRASADEVKLASAPPVEPANERPCREPPDVDQVYPRVNLNQADEAALLALPGIGETKARAILAYRSSHGALRNLAELLQVKGIGRALLKRLRPLVTL